MVRPGAASRWPCATRRPIGELASGLAHELNQPLSAIANGVEACARYVRAGTTRSADLLALLDDASAEALRAGSSVEHLRHFIE